VTAQPTAPPLGGPDRGFDARLDRGMGKIPHATGMLIMVALDTRRTTSKRSMVALNDFQRQNQRAVAA
jgi:hypothetical protein